MGSAFPNYTILLSVRSPILAPLYLAKIRGNAFRHINFKYAFELPLHTQSGGPPEHQDILVQYVLSKSIDKQHYIAGVADPFRCLMQSDGALYKPKILGCLIRHQTFWLASDDPALKEGSAFDKASECEYIITQPRYTSGYAVIKDFLKLEIADNSEGINIDVSSDPNKPRLFHNTLPGFEREYYLKLQRKSCREGKYAYLTTNPADHEGPIAQFSHLPAHADGERYKNTLMSALFCGNGWSCKYPAFFDELRGDIARAIEVIISDPIRAAVELKEYSAISGDRYMNFSNDFIPHHRLVEILDDLIRDKIYSRDLTIAREQIRRGVAIRPRFQKRAQDSAAAREPTPWARYGSGSDGELDIFIKHYFDSSIVRKQMPPDAFSGATIETGDRERTEKMPLFVRRSINNYRQLAEESYRASVYAKSITLASQTITNIPKAIVSSLWLIFAVLLAIPYPEILLNGHALSTQIINLLTSLYKLFGITKVNFDQAAFQQAFGLLTLSSLSLLVPAYMVRYTSKERTKLVYDLVFLLTLALDGAISVWALIRWLNPELKSGITPGDKLSIELFYFSNAILVFGGFGLAARERFTDLWEKIVLKWVEWRTKKKIASQFKIPPPWKCGKKERCLRCKLKSRPIT